LEEATDSESLSFKIVSTEALTQCVLTVRVTLIVDNTIGELFPSPMSLICGKSNDDSDPERNEILKANYASHGLLHSLG